MRDFEGYRFIDLAHILGHLVAVHAASDMVIPDEWRSKNTSELVIYRPILNDLGMDASAASLEKLIMILGEPGIKFSALVGIAMELQGRLKDQSERRMIFALNPRETDYGMKPRAGWETAIARFPSIGTDVDEAAFCLALSRYPAAVYHTVQITELGLVELGKFLKVKDPTSGWTSVANALEAVIDKKYADRTPFEKKHFASLEQIQGTVQALKNAWRNKISHVQGRLVLLKTDFGWERSEEIVMATRAFMRRLAEDLPAPKVRRRRISDLAMLTATDKSLGEIFAEYDNEKKEGFGS